MNRTALILFSIITICFTIAAAEAPATIFEQGNKLYGEGKYVQALEQYTRIESELKHWKLFYNIGNCFYKLNNFVQAKIYFLRAKKLKPFESSILANLRIVNARFKDKIPKEKKDFIANVIVRIESIISLNLLAVIVLLLIIIFNTAIFLIIKSGRSKLLIYLASFSLVFILIMGGYLTYRVQKQGQKTSAVITKSESELRSGPGTNNTILFKTNQGLQVKIIARRGTWLWVSASPEIAGWIVSDHLEEI